MKPWTEARNDKYMNYHSKLTYQLTYQHGKGGMKPKLMGQFLLHNREHFIFRVQKTENDAEW